ncbi:hypothetical protein [Flaviaesturariibacter amylovorans]|uniref:DUF2970 domain-containing protein n=1 Tax=Flaviaesturariibacter amylovorans TaxID=1084520 RepID=A0ABP8HUJ0_9BACT
MVKYVQQVFETHIALRDRTPRFRVFVSVLFLANLAILLSCLVGALSGAFR